MNFGPILIIFGDLKNLLWISKWIYKPMSIFSKWFNQILLEFEILTQIPYLNPKHSVHKFEQNWNEFNSKPNLILNLFE
jgi:hypothetical protein